MCPIPEKARYQGIQTFLPANPVSTFHSASRFGSLAECGVGHLLPCPTPLASLATFCHDMDAMCS